MRAPTPSKPDESSDGLTDMPEALRPVLRETVWQLKVGNNYMQTTHAGMQKLTRMLWAGAAIGGVLLGGLGASLTTQFAQKERMDAQLVQQAQTNDELARVVSTLRDTYTAASETREVLSEQPTITVKPANTADPESKPMLVVAKKKPSAVRRVMQSLEPKKSVSADSSASDDTIEIPLDLPPAKK